MLGYLFFFLAAFVNGLLDTLCFNENNSILTKYGDWWFPRKAYGKYPKFLGSTMDAYHLFKYLMIFLLALSVKFYSPFFADLWLIYYIFEMAIVWGIGFELSRKIFKN